MNDDNMIQNWINSDKGLYDKLVEIQNKEQDERKQAELAFHQITQIYSLPKMPEDNANEEFVSSVYEQLGLLKYLEPKGDIRGHILSSIYYVKEEYEVDKNLVFQKKFGNINPGSDFIGFGYRGSDIDVSVVFVMNGQNWVDLGCNYFIREVHLP